MATPYQINTHQMNTKTRSLLKTLAILLVLAAVLLELDILNLAFAEPYKLWMTVLGFGILLLASK